MKPIPLSITVKSDGTVSALPMEGSGFEPEEFMICLRQPGRPCNCPEAHNAAQCDYHPERWVLFLKYKENLPPDLAILSFHSIEGEFVQRFEGFPEARPGVILIEPRSGGRS